jgi:hypothetical protein
MIEDDPYAELVGSASDDVAEVLATGTREITSLYLSLSARHPHGKDAEYLAWHTLDHRPEQYRLKEIKASLRLVSTPACRAARAAAEPPFDSVDHVMAYFFTSTSGLAGFAHLATALKDAGRMTHALPSVQPGVYEVEERVAHQRIKAGADTLPWWPAKGAYLLIEDGEPASLKPLVDLPGVVGAWATLGQPGPFSKTGPTQRASILFLDGDPVVTAAHIHASLTERWSSARMTPLLAAPFPFVVPHDWERYLP